MYALIEIATRSEVGIFATSTAALAWADAHGGRALYAVIPW